MQKGLRQSEAGQYREAINTLEEAWELDSSNPVVAEHLALSYLNEEYPPGEAALRSARWLLRFSLENGGQATVRARHLHRGWQWFKSTEDSCFGRLLVNADGVHYIATDSDHSFSLEPAAIDTVTLAKQNPSFAGIFNLKTADGARYRLRTGTRTHGEAKLFVDLILNFVIGG